MAGTLLDSRRARALGLMGIDVYRLRGRTETAEPAAAATPGFPALHVGAAEAAITTGVHVLPARIKVALDAAAGNPRTGPHAALLAQIVRALGVAPAEVAFDAGGDKAGCDATVPLLCFGVAPPASELAHGFAPLAAVRQGPTVKRSLWKALRPLRRRLRQG